MAEPSFEKMTTEQLRDTEAVGLRRCLDKIQAMKEGAAEHTLDAVNYSATLLAAFSAHRQANAAERSAQALERIEEHLGEGGWITDAILDRNDDQRGR